MSDINFCETKEQLNHLGEVVTGKTNGSPSGADIETSTLPYTGQVRNTLPALEELYLGEINEFIQESDQVITDKTAELDAAVDSFIQESDQVIAEKTAEFDTSIANKEVEADAAIDSYRLLNKGPYASGITLESKFEYITYNGEAYFATNPPYTTTATTPDADGNLFISGYTTFENVANKIGNKNELSNSNFLTPSPEAITHPNPTPESYVAGTQIFSGVHAGDSGCTITFIDGRVNCTAGDYQFKLPNTGGLERIPAFTSSVSDYDGIPKTTGVSHALVGDEYIVTVTPAAGDVFSVKFEQGTVATRHEVGFQKKYIFDTIADMKRSYPTLGSVCETKGYWSAGDGGGATYVIKNSGVGGTIDHSVGDMFAVIDIGYTLESRQIGLSISRTPSQNSACLSSFTEKISSEGRGYRLFFTEIYDYDETWVFPEINGIEIDGLRTSSGLRMTEVGKNGVNLPEGYNRITFRNIILNGPSREQMKDAGFGFFGGDTDVGRAHGFFNIRADFWNIAIRVNNMYGGDIVNFTVRNAYSTGLRLRHCNAVNIGYINIAYVGEFATPDSLSVSTDGWGVVIDGGNNNIIRSGNIFNCGTRRLMDGTEVDYPTGGGGVLLRGNANQCQVNYYFEVVGPTPNKSSNVAINITQGCVGNTYNGGLSYPNVVVDNGAGTVRDNDGSGVFKANPRTLKGNVDNPCFEDASKGVEGWSVSSGATLARAVGGGYSGDYKALATFPLSGGDQQLTRSPGYRLSADPGDTIYVSFAIRTNRNMGHHGTTSGLPDRIQLGIHAPNGIFGEVEPANFRAMRTDANKWQHYSCQFQAKNFHTSEIWFTIQVKDITSDVVMEITDIVFAVGDRNISEGRGVRVEDSTSTDIVSIQRDLNALISALRLRGAIQ